MRPIDTILIYVLIPIVVLLILFALTALRPSGGRGARYRVGDDWPHEPLWWIGNPKGTGLPEPTVDAVGVPATRTARGGARGTW